MFKKIILTALLALTFISCDDGKKPEETITPETKPYQTPTPDTVKPVTETPKSEFDYTSVDKTYNMTELSKIRKATHDTDTCVGSFKTFGSAIDNAVEEHMLSYKNRVEKLASYYQVPTELNSHLATSLISHNLCEGFTSLNLKDILKNIPGQATIDKMNAFSNLSNKYRKEDKTKFKNLWKKFFSCLAYTESLTTADTASSLKVAKKFNFTKPDGVKFYDDPGQTEASRYNIGLYQFTPDPRGNVNPCLLNWNDQYSCDIKIEPGTEKYVKLFGSGQQVFNAWCGVNKVVGTYAIQINSNSSKRYFGSNKDRQSRCVTPFIFASYGYNHFGPLQNSTGKNLDKLLSCALK